MIENNDSKIKYTNGSVKGVYLGHSETKLYGEDKFKAKYGYTLQEVNDRILSYRPNTITNYRPVTEMEKLLQHREFLKWDGRTWDYGKYSNLDINDKNNGPDQALFMDFKILVTSSACMRGYQRPDKVRGGTPEDVNDFFNYSVINLLERRLKQFQFDSKCRILDNWPSYIARVLPQYLSAFNKSKFDYQVETYWPMVKDDESGQWKEQDFGIEDVPKPEMFDAKTLARVYDRVVDSIPEARAFSSDILLYFLTGKGFSNQRLVKQLAEIVKIQIYEGVETLL